MEKSDLNSGNGTARDRGLALPARPENYKLEPEYAGERATEHGQYRLKQIPVGSLRRSLFNRN